MSTLQILDDDDETQRNRAAVGLRKQAVHVIKSQGLGVVKEDVNVCILIEKKLKVKTCLKSFVKAECCLSLFVQTEWPGNVEWGEMEGSGLTPVFPWCVIYHGRTWRTAGVCCSEGSH